ncbi:Uncharacterised protein [Vibrio cholerae]|nr:Uncharacterised protein [Vibrio cholerae]
MRPDHYVNALCAVFYQDHRLAQSASARPKSEYLLHQRLRFAPDLAEPIAIGDLTPALTVVAPARSRH